MPSMDNVHPIMQKALVAFGTNMFTVNPAFPHPDQDSDQVQALPLDEAIAWALKVLKDPNADQFTRNQAASELDAAWVNHKE